MLFLLLVSVFFTSKTFNMIFTLSLQNEAHSSSGCPPFLHKWCAFFRKHRAHYTFFSLIYLHNSFYLSIYSSNERALIRWTTWHVIIFRSLCSRWRPVRKRKKRNIQLFVHIEHDSLPIYNSSSFYIEMRRNEEEKGQPSNVKTNSKK